ncbi:MAG: hypothetical protein IPG94_17085 [Kineosporiaceae bacterium]|nr:hypothetical protein [Kineosporiaceae bacterium]
MTVTAVVCLALLGADRALTFDRVLDTVEPLATYLAARQRPVAGAATLTDRSTIRRTLQELTASGVLDCYDAGTEPVWRIAPDQHLVAAFYRNTVIHFLVERAIGEVALLSVGDTAGGLAGAWHTALALRDLLKFEFFFGSRTDFLADLRQELTLLTGVTASADTDLSPQAARELLAGSRPHLAPLVLRPFLDAYLLVADRLAAWVTPSWTTPQPGTCSPKPCRWASNGCCNGGWPAPSRSRWSCSAPGYAWSSTGVWCGARTWPPVGRRCGTRSPVWWPNSTGSPTWIAPPGLRIRRPISY